MSVTIYLSGHLKEFTRGETEVTEQGEIRQHVNIFLGSADIKRLDGLRTPLTDDELHIFNAVSGG
jgi:molybdopterin converting factor small subunit